MHEITVVSIGPITMSNENARFLMRSSSEARLVLLARVEYTQVHSQCVYTQPVDSGRTYFYLRILFNRNKSDIHYFHESYLLNLVRGNLYCHRRDWKIIYSHDKIAIILIREVKRID